ncbi:hypothetical protein MTP04_06570 [Lysinibacillus sp. PLM2]|nr:hypothetical protein MTP04_06570 [Lysinibacillus sp. PLM2]
MIDLWLQLRDSQKEKIILYYFPECDFLNDDVKKILEYLYELPVNPLCFSIEILARRDFYNELWFKGYA